MLRTFNCGIGMVAIVPGDRTAQALSVLAEAGEQAHLIGRVEAVPGAGRIEIRP
jgi:phosphoribosylformylglycinamidine cyclo-ligase